jgi:CBS domain-containing protein
VKVHELLLEPMATVPETASYAESVKGLVERGVRRMPVVDSDGLLVGIVTLDDLVQQLAKPLAELSALAQLERRHEMVTRR